MNLRKMAAGALSHDAIFYLSNDRWSESLCKVVDGVRYFRNGVIAHGHLCPIDDSRAIWVEEFHPDIVKQNLIDALKAYNKINWTEQGVELLDCLEF